MNKLIIKCYTFSLLFAVFAMGHSLSTPEDGIVALEDCVRDLGVAGATLNDNIRLINSASLSIGRHFSAEENKKIVGAASISFISGTCLIKELTVDKSAKNKGYGSALVKEIEKRAASNGCCKVWAYSAVLYNAKRFYEKNGYAEEGLLKNHFYGLDHYIFGKVL